MSFKKGQKPWNTKTKTFNSVDDAVASNRSKIEQEDQAAVVASEAVIETHQVPTEKSPLAGWKLPVYGEVTLEMSPSRDGWLRCRRVNVLGLEEHVLVHKSQVDRVKSALRISSAHLLVDGKA
jgi:hypothetical protein